MMQGVGRLMYVQSSQVYELIVCIWNKPLPSREPEEFIAIDLIREYDGAWWDAAKSGNAADLIQMIEKQGRDINLKDSEGRTALSYCGGLGRVDAIEALLERGAVLIVQLDAIIFLFYKTERSIEKISCICIN